VSRQTSLARKRQGSDRIEHNPRLETAVIDPDRVDACRFERSDIG
jgi:hypothetical protein